MWYSGITHASGACNPGSIPGIPTSRAEFRKENPEARNDGNRRKMENRGLIPCFLFFAAKYFFYSPKGRADPY